MLEFKEEDKKRIKDFNESLKSMLYIGAIFGVLFAYGMICANIGFQAGNIKGVD